MPTYSKTAFHYLLLLFLITIPGVVLAQPANDNCSGALPISSSTSCSYVTYNIRNATSNTSLPAGSCGGATTTTTYDMWFSFQAQATSTTILLGGFGSLLTPGSGVYVEFLSGAACGGFASLLCGDATVARTVTGLTVGNTYYIRVYTVASPTASGGNNARWDYTLCLTHPAPPPANDNCSSAISLTSYSNSCTSTTGTVAGATNSGVAVSSCGGTADDDVWYSFTAVQAATLITLGSQGGNLSSSGTRMELFSGTCGTLTSQGCSSGSTLAFNTLTPGATYYVRVYSAGASTLNTDADFTICVTHFAPPANDNCAGAVTLTAGTSCTNTTGTLVGALNSGIAVSSCGGAADDDVWYQFTAISGPLTTVTLSSLGSALTGNTTLELFSGSCGSLTSIACATGTSVSASLTAGNVYYVRVYSTGATAITSNGGFSICVATPAPPTPATVLTGKSFINITRPGGGTIVPGDVLEIRVSVNVSNAGTNRIFRSRFNDTIPSNLTYVAGSLKLLTNEGKQYAAYTDAAGDDAAMYNGTNKTIRFNLGRDTSGMPRGFVSNTGIDSTGGGYTNSGTHAPRGNGMLVIVTYRVTVDAATPYNTIINYGSGAVRYRNQLSSVGAVDYTLAPNSLSFIIYPNYGLCSNATGANNVNAGNGDFGSGTSHNGPNPGAAVPGYTYLSITTGAPNDGMYSVVKNLSPSQSTNPFIPRPEDPNVNRVFRVWDIIGDHTGAADPLAGNPPSPSGANGGYMLAVNAAYQLSIANNQTITGLCENTYYEFSAWFRNVCKRCGSDSLGRGASNLTVPAGYIPTAPGDSSGVKPNLTFMINGVDYYTSGDMDYIGNYGQWVKKGFVFLTAPGQTSLTISIKNNAPGGGGNDWVMDDISFATCLPSLTMRPTNSPTYCNNNQVDISVAVSTFFNNYNYYEWERSTDGGTTWISAPEMPGQQTFNFTNYSGEYRDTAFLPSFVAGTSYDGYKYRIRVGTTNTNLTSGACALYNDVDIITINVAPTCDVLPIELIQFNVQLKDDFAALYWKAKQESNLVGYTIERSTDGKTFKAIGTMTAKGALANEEQYFFRDNEPVYGKVYYRLRLSAVGGGTKFSNVLAVQPGQVKLFDVNSLVNPFASQIAFQVTVPEKELLDVQLFDATGRFITNKKLAVNKGSNAVVVDVPSYLQVGSYLVRIISKYGQVNKSIQKK